MSFFGDVRTSWYNFLPSFACPHFLFSSGGFFVDEQCNGFEGALFFLRLEGAGSRFYFHIFVRYTFWFVL
jgi:hypothetical protein